MLDHIHVLRIWTHQRKSSKVIQTAVFMHNDKFNNYYRSNRKVCHYNGGILKHVCVRLVAQLCLTLCDLTDCGSPGSSMHGDSPGKNTGVGFYVLLQGIFPTQGSKPGVPHCRQILYHPSHQGSPWILILEWVAYSLPRGSSWPRNQTWVSYIVGGFFTS